MNVITVGSRQSAELSAGEGPGFSQGGDPLGAISTFQRFGKSLFGETSCGGSSVRVTWSPHPLDPPEGTKAMGRALSLAILSE